MPGDQTTPITFGGGIDRNTGSGSVNPEAFYDLRNTHLTVGKSWPRGGLGSLQTFASEDAILAIYPIRSQGLGAVITYRISDRTVRLYLTSADGTTSAAIGIIWTLPVNSPFPQVSVTDSYNKIFIAHDQADITIRQQTAYYDVPTATLTPMVANFDNTGNNPVLFRGVQRYLNYLTAWGFGSNTDKDRPEILRISIPGDPVTFDPQAIFYAGQRGEPILSCQEAGTVLAVLKETESFKVTGYDRTTFGIEPLDKMFGVIGSRLAFSINGQCFFWSAEGPRGTSGDASIDLAFPLDLGGPSPDVLAAAAIADNGFVCYLPEKRELQFIFGQWGYVLHLRDPGNMRWSYRQFPITLNAAGLLYPGGFTTGLGPDATMFPSVVITSGVGSTSLTVGWTNNGVLAGITVEVWGKRYDTGAWSMLSSGTVAAGATQSVAVSVLMGMSYDFAVRYKKNNLYNTAYQGAPSTWPATSLTTSTTTTTIPTPTVTAGAWSRTSGTMEQIIFTVNTAPQSHVICDIDTNGAGGTDSHSGESTVNLTSASNGATPWAGETTYSYRIRYRTAYVTGAYSGNFSQYTGPTIMTGGTNIKGANIGAETFYSFQWTNPADWAQWTYKLQSNEDGAGFGFDDVTGAEVAGAMTVAGGSTPYACGAGHTLQFRVRSESTAFSVLDFSPWLTGTLLNNTPC